MKKLDLLITGTGGQGIIVASDIISEAALNSGYDVKKTDTLGMAQRGGGVVSHVRIARQVWSPLIKEGEVDILVAFEKLEAARWVHYLRPDAVVIINNLALPPLSVTLGSERYPGDEEIAGMIKPWSKCVYFINGTNRARELGNVRLLSTFMLGCVSTFVPIKVGIWKETISRHVPPTTGQINMAAFNLGRKEIKNANL